MPGTNLGCWGYIGLNCHVQSLDVMLRDRELGKNVKSETSRPVLLSSQRERERENIKEIHENLLISWYMKVPI